MRTCAGGPSCMLRLGPNEMLTWRTRLLLSIMQARADIAASFQHAALTHLEERVARGAGWALLQHPRMRHLVAAGGVAANTVLRAKLQARAVCALAVALLAQTMPRTWHSDALGCTVRATHGCD